MTNTYTFTRRDYLTIYLDCFSYTGRLVDIKPLDHFDRLRQRIAINKENGINMSIDISTRNEILNLFTVIFNSYNKQSCEKLNFPMDIFLNKIFIILHMFDHASVFKLNKQKLHSFDKVWIKICKDLGITDAIDTPLIKFAGKIN